MLPPSPYSHQTYPMLFPCYLPHQFSQFSSGIISWNFLCNPKRASLQHWPGVLIKWIVDDRRVTFLLTHKNARCGKKCVNGLYGLQTNGNASKLMKGKVAWHRLMQENWLMRPDIGQYAGHPSASIYTGRGENIKYMDAYAEMLQICSALCVNGALHCKLLESPCVMWPSPVAVAV